MSDFPATRAEALDRLAAFVPLAGRAYAERRNFEEGPGGHRHVSRLCAALRRRLVSEEEVIAAVLAAHPLAEAEKFIAEVCWRTYWKGWLEQRPALWGAHLAELDAARDRLANDRLLADRHAAAIDGRTGIAAFDAWAQELASTGYLHNWARMQFASIWLFTLRLPIALGIAHTQGQFIDADPASNTLSWRWVAGAHTPGKTYLAEPERIAAMTRGRLSADGLATRACAIDTVPSPAAGPLRSPRSLDPALPSLLLLTSDDLSLDAAPSGRLSTDPGRCAIRAVALLEEQAERGAAATALSGQAGANALARAAARFACTALPPLADGAALATAATAISARQIIMPFATTGPTRDAIAAALPPLEAAGIAVGEVQRRWDAAAWPHCGKGFFALKQHIPALIEAAGIVRRRG